MTTQEYHGIPFSDFMRLQTLKPGMIVSFKGIEEKLIIGNCTPYNEVSSHSDEGWDWSFWKDYLVTQVDYINGPWITPEQITIARQNNKQAG